MSTGLGHSSQATILFNRTIRVLLLRVNRSMMICDCEEKHYNTLELRQNKFTKNDATIEEPISLHTWSTVAVQREGGGPRMHDTIIEHGNYDQN